MIVSSLSKLLKKLRGKRHASLFLKCILMIIKRNQDDMFLFRQIKFKNKTSLKMETITVQGLQSRKVTIILWSILWRSFVLKQIKACITWTDTKIIHTRPGGIPYYVPDMTVREAFQNHINVWSLPRFLWVDNKTFLRLAIEIQ